MRTLEQIKDDYAKEKGYESWISLYQDCAFRIGTFENHMNEICILAQKEALKNASESVNEEDCFAYSSERNRFDSVEHSILNENNIIK